MKLKFILLALLISISAGSAVSAISNEGNQMEQSILISDTESIIQTEDYITSNRDILDLESASEQESNPIQEEKQNEGPIFIETFYGFESSYFKDGVVKVKYVGNGSESEDDFQSNLSELDNNSYNNGTRVMDFKAFESFNKDEVKQVEVPERLYHMLTQYISTDIKIMVKTNNGIEDEESYLKSNPILLEQEMSYNKVKKDEPKVANRTFQSVENKQMQNKNQDKDLYSTLTPLEKINPAKKYSINEFFQVEFAELENQVLKTKNRVMLEVEHLSMTFLKTNAVVGRIALSNDRKTKTILKDMVPAVTNSMDTIQSHMQVIEKHTSTLKLVMMCNKDNAQESDFEDIMRSINITQQMLKKLTNLIEKTSSNILAIDDCIKKYVNM